MRNNAAGMRRYFHYDEDEIRVEFYRMQEKIAKLQNYQVKLQNHPQRLQNSL